MKNIQVYEDSKYSGEEFQMVEPNIYQKSNGKFVTSLSFEQEEEFDEGSSPSDISEYPLESILDVYSVSVSDFYEEKNAASDSICYQEFSSRHIENIQALLSIVGKHVFVSDGMLKVE